MNLKEKIQHKIDFKTKPLGALGLLEQIALKIALIQETTTPSLNNPHLIVFTADHGLAKSGVSAYPQEVTPQMVLNFLNGGAAINVFCKQNDINLSIVDSGVNFDFEPNSKLIDSKIAYGTANILENEAMTIAQFNRAVKIAKELVNSIHDEGCNIIGFGEMGIGNTSSSSLVLSKLFNLPIEDLVGRGTGMNDEQLISKIKILTQVLKVHQTLSNNPQDILRTLGGFEIVQMYAAMKQAKENKMVILIDGFIATAAFSVAYKEDPTIVDYAIFCHQSDEQAHGQILNLLNVKPILNINLRVGEGTGCALAYPIIKSAVNFINEMSSFEEAQVSNKS
jgi:nicotinate-nucleotide--dimethylbenzimidazole phosphoribosyltransferase